jgi:hypothetical protein
MRPLPLAFCAALAFAPAAGAAPTCERLDGLTARCGTPGAMPVGWKPTPAQLLERRLAHPDGPIGFEIAGSLALIGALMALIALMPKFDGWSPGDWDEQEGEARPRPPR